MAAASSDVIESVCGVAASQLRNSSSFGTAHSARMLDGATGTHDNVLCHT